MITVQEITQLPLMERYLIKDELQEKLASLKQARGNDQYPFLVQTAIMRYAREIRAKKKWLDRSVVDYASKKHE